MSRTRLTLLAGVSGLTLILAGCEEGSLLPKPEGEASAAAERPAASALVERDVEAPDVFHTSDKGLWDGRPSLGGVWVAHPDVDDPERVIIRNKANGKFVIGALFRRERDNPGPSLQVSSDAAASLGLLAGQPTMLEVTALRRAEEKAPEAETEALAADQPAEAQTIAPPDAIATETLEDVASAAIAAAEGTAVETSAPAAAPATDAATVAASAQADAEGAAPAAEGTTTVVASEPRAPRVPFWERLRRKPADPANALIAEAVTDTTPAGTAITSDLLEPIPAAAIAAPSPAGTATGSGSLVQIGIFSVEDNARRAADIMTKNGVVPNVTESRSQGKTYWRVTVGPAPKGRDMNRLLAKVKDLGFADAFAVAR